MARSVGTRAVIWSKRMFDDMTANTSRIVRFVCIWQDLHKKPVVSTIGQQHDIWTVSVFQAIGGSKHKTNQLVKYNEPMYNIQEFHLFCLYVTSTDCGTPLTDKYQNSLSTMC